MPNANKQSDFHIKPLKGPVKSRRKNAGGQETSHLVFGKRTKGGITVERAPYRKVPKPGFDESGLATNSKYAVLGPHCRANVALAISEGFVYTRTAGTTEEQVIYGELRRRGFTTPLGTSSRSFLPQSDIAGINVDFEVWDRGELIALRPQNDYWHGHLQQINSDQAQDERIRAAGYTLYEIWSHDSLTDEGLKLKMTQFFGSV